MPDDRPLLDAAWRQLESSVLVRLDRLGGRSRRVYRCVGATGRAVIARIGDVTRLATEEAIIAHVRDNGIPAPEVLYRHGDVMLQALAPGRPLAEEPIDLAPVGEMLERLHAIRTTGFGRLGPDLHAPAASFAAWFIDDIRGPAEAAQHIDPDSAVLIDRALAELEDHRDLLDQSRPGFAHGDFSPANILARRGRVTAILDWEASKSGPPALDIGWWDLFATDPLATGGLLAGYQSIDREALPTQCRLVQLRVTLSQFSWCTKANDPDGVAAAGRRLATLMAR